MSFRAIPVYLITFALLHLFVRQIRLCASYYITSMAGRQAGTMDSRRVCLDVYSWIHIIATVRKTCDHRETQKRAREIESKRATQSHFNSFEIVRLVHVLQFSSLLA